MIEWSWRGRIALEAAVAEMEQRRAGVVDGDDAAAHLLLCEHDPVITLGRGADRRHVLGTEADLAARGARIVGVSRGGDVTFHGPGQLMIYPVVKLRRGVVRFLESVAAAIAEVAASLGVPGAAWRRDPAGVWIDGAKLAACGLHVRRGVAIHGFALNVATDPAWWRLIVPCGLPACPPLSLADRLGPATPTVAEVAALAGPIIAKAISH